MTLKSEIALISLGSNAPSAQTAVTSLVLNGRSEVAAALGADAVFMSDLFATPAYPPGIGPDFVNAAMAIHTTLPARAILNALHNVEAAAHRVRDVRWGLRTLDLDLLALGDQVAPDVSIQTQWRVLSPDLQRTMTPDQLILPHPRLQDRAFVLVPLAQVAPDWAHPVLGLTVVQMRDALPASDLAGIKPVTL